MYQCLWQTARHKTGPSLCDVLSAMWATPRINMYRDRTFVWSWSSCVTSALPSLPAVAHFCRSLGLQIRCCKVSGGSHGAALCAGVFAAAGWLLLAWCAGSTVGHVHSALCSSDSLLALAVGSVAVPPLCLPVAGPASAGMYPKPE